MALTEDEKRVKDILSKQFHTYVKINEMRERAEKLEIKGDYEAAETIHEQADQLQLVLDIYERDEREGCERGLERANCAYHFISMRNARNEKITLDELGALYLIKGERMRQLLNKYARHVAQRFKDEVRS
jgi:hypothetical protein